MVKTHLGVVTCDKCGDVMQKGQRVLVVAEGAIAEAGEELLTFEQSWIRYACHLDCWDGVEEPI